MLDLMHTFLRAAVLDGAQSPSAAVEAACGYARNPQNPPARREDLTAEEADQFIAWVAADEERALRTATAHFRRAGDGWVSLDELGQAGNRAGRAFSEIERCEAGRIWEVQVFELRGFWWSCIWCSDRFTSIVSEAYDERELAAEWARKRIYEEMH